MWVEARSFISSAIVNADDIIKYDWYGGLAGVIIPSLTLGIYAQVLPEHLAICLRR